MCSQLCAVSSTRPAASMPTAGLAATGMGSCLSTIRPASTILTRALRFRASGQRRRTEGGRSGTPLGGTTPWRDDPSAVSPA